MHTLSLTRVLKTLGITVLLLYAASLFFYSYSQGFPRVSFLRIGQTLLHSSTSSSNLDVAISTAPPTLSSSQPSATASNDNRIESTPEPAVIVAAVAMDTDLSWLSEVNASTWKLHRYNYDDPNPPPHAWIPANKGHEAMIYLSYIISNYDSLADYSIFIHGHRQSWHQQGDMVDLIKRIQIPALQRDGYVPLRCDWYPSCPAEIRPIDHDATVWGPGVHREDAEREIGKAWKELFGSVEMPRTIASQCCAQFAVTREAVHRRSKADYERMREWLLRSELIDDISGRVLEKLWAYIMTGDAIRCPPPQQCACQYFGQCAPRDWPVPPEGLAKWE